MNNQVVIDVEIPLRYRNSGIRLSPFITENHLFSTMMNITSTHLDGKFSN